MREYRYVTLDPTGNLTCLVLDPAGAEERAGLTRILLKECEQVAYLEKPETPGAVAAIRLMGGEFCGNAAMAAAAWLVRDELKAGEEKSFLLEVSGAPDPVPCRIRALKNGYEGTVEMPPVREIRQETIGGIPFTLVRTDGIAHLVHEGRPLEREADALKEIAGILPDDAIGLLQWDREKMYMDPLVYVRGSGSIVRETGCGSGSAAVGALEALRHGDGTRTTPVGQPGGVIRATAAVKGNEILSVQITGHVRLGKESAVGLPRET